MAARVQVIIEAKDQSSGVFRTVGSHVKNLAGSINNVANSYGGWADIAARAGQAVINTLKESVAATREYAKEVRDLALVSGTGAEESSRLLQVLDDFEISADDVNTAVRKMTQQGIVPTVDALAKLSDEYRTINGAQERNEFILKNLGRSGLQWVNVLNQGGKAIRELSDGVNENLILTDENIKASEEYRLALDDWNDSVLALKISIGNQLLPILTDLINTDADKAILRAAEATGVAGIAAKALTEDVEAAAGEFDYWSKILEGNQAALQGTTLSAEELEEQVKAISETNKAFIGVLGNVQGQVNAYREGMALAKAELAAGTINTEEYRAKTEELGATFEATKNKIILSIVEMKLASDGWTDAELSAYLQIGQQLGQFDQKMVTTTKSYITQANNLVNATTQIEEPLLHLGTLADNTSQAFGGFENAQSALAAGINAEALPAMAGLKTQFQGMPPTGTAWDYVFNIEVNGRVPNLPARTQAPVALLPGQQSFNQNTQAGGQVYAGNPTWVGERGMEPFIPAVNGRILGHAESLRAMSMGNAMGNSGGGTMYNYGTIELTISEGGASDIMGLR
jgi:hypothetical protein